VEGLPGKRFHLVDLTGARFEQVDMTGVVMRGVELVDVDIDGEVWNLIINGVDVAPLIEAELNRRHPDRAKMRPTTPEGFREAWDIIERLWDETMARARRLDPELLHASVDGEWSFIQTLRHLVFATDAWIRRVLLGAPSPGMRSICRSIRWPTSRASRGTATCGRRWTTSWPCGGIGWRPCGRCWLSSPRRN